MMPELASIAEAIRLAQCVLSVEEQGEATTCERRLATNSGSNSPDQ